MIEREGAAGAPLEMPPLAPVISPGEDGEGRTDSRHVLAEKVTVPQQQQVLLFSPAVVDRSPAAVTERQEPQRERLVMVIVIHKHSDNGHDGSDGGGLVDHLVDHQRADGQDGGVAGAQDLLLGLRADVISAGLRLRV